MVDGLESVQLHMIQLVTVMNNVKKGETEETKILRMMNYQNQKLLMRTMTLAKLFLVPKLIKNVNFRGQNYKTCISGSKRRRPWCSTGLNANGGYVAKMWGFCNTSKCPLPEEA